MKDDMLRWFGLGERMQNVNKYIMLENYHTEPFSPNVRISRIMGTR